MVRRPPRCHHHQCSWARVGQHSVLRNAAAAAADKVVVVVPQTRIPTQHGVQCLASSSQHTPQRDVSFYVLSSLSLFFVVFLRIRRVLLV